MRGRRGQRREGEKRDEKEIRECRMLNKTDTKNERKG